MNTSHPRVPAQRRLSRRSLAVGATWSVPVIAVAATAPAYATSPNWDTSVDSPNPQPNNYAAKTMTLYFRHNTGTIPGPVTYTVVVTQDKGTYSSLYEASVNSPDADLTNNGGTFGTRSNATYGYNALGQRTMTFTVTLLPAMPAPDDVFILVNIPDTLFGSKSWTLEVTKTAGPADNNTANDTVFYDLHN